MQEQSPDSKREGILSLINKHFQAAEQLFAAFETTFTTFENVSNEITSQGEYANKVRSIPYLITTDNSPA